MSALWRVQSKGCFASVLAAVERRSMTSSRSSSSAAAASSSRGRIGPTSNDRDVGPSGRSPGAGGRWISSNGGRSNSEGVPVAAGFGEQPAALQRTRYKSFQPRRESSLGIVREQPRVVPFEARRSAATTATEEIVRGALCAVVAARTSVMAAGNGPSGGGELISRTQQQ